MSDENLAHICAHRSDIRRYRSLLRTTLSDLAREFIEWRLSEERTALEAQPPKPSPSRSLCRQVRPPPQAQERRHNGRSGPAH
jgi:hypothetical protein